jgi:ATP-binding cassette subfamily F protein uup
LWKLSPSQGEVVQGTNVSIVYFDQMRTVLDPEKSVWQNVAPGGSDTVRVNGVYRHVISYLQDFLFTSDRAKSPVKQLSGGERNRLMLARLFTQPSNVLVFDEPTNDLDTESLELLEELLVQYNGTILVVSHDREFLNNVVTSMLVFEGGGIVHEYMGGYDDWERQVQARQAQPPVKKSLTTSKVESGITTAPDTRKKLSFKEKRLLETLPSQIEEWEREYETVNLQMADPEMYTKPAFITDAKVKCAELEGKITEAYRVWEELTERE